MEQLSLFELGTPGATLDLLSTPRTLDNLDSYCPHTNPRLNAFVGANRREGTCYEVKPLPEGLVAGKNTYVYDAHTYHTKVPPQAIAYLIEHYAEPGELVLDPFCGSGMTGVAALRTGRIPILIDLSPAATFIAYNFLMIFNEQNVFQVFERKAQTIQQYLATWAIASATPFCISTQSATDLGAIPDDSIDYISTAPPSAEISTILR